MSSKLLKRIRYGTAIALIALMFLSGFPLDFEYDERGKIVDILYLAMKKKTTIDNFYFGNYAHAASTTIILSPTILTSGTTWVVPSDWDNASNTIEVIGGGGGGEDNGDSGGGGGGGGYSKSVNVTLTAGDVVSYQIGSGGATDTGADGADGGDTFFCNATSNCATIAGSAVLVGAKGGKGGGTVTADTGGVGGAAGSGIAEGTGSTTYSGGNGGTGNGIADSGGGGGGAAGPRGNGQNGGNGYTVDTSGGGGGGGGAGGGSSTAGLNSTTTTNGGGAGGKGPNGTGSGVCCSSGTGGSGSNGGGGSGSDAGVEGGTGGSGTEWNGGVGAGGGGGGASDSDFGGNGGLFGGGGGAGENGGGVGAPGIIVITYARKAPNAMTWVVPSDWDDSANKIEIIGGGGAGYSSNNSSGAAGGGGGAYSRSINVNFIPGATSTFAIGRGATGSTSSGGDTYLCDSTSNCSDINGTAVVVGAKGGTSASSTTANGIGGAAADGYAETNGVEDGTNSAKWSGGNANDGHDTCDCGGGGGGAGGITAAGKAGGTTGTTGGDGGGGGGGAGGASSSDGAAGTTLVGGNGGAGRSGSGGGAGGSGDAGDAGTAATGGGGGGGDASFSGGDGASGSEWTSYGAGGGGGGVGDNTGVIAIGGDGGLYGGGGGGGIYGGHGGPGIIVITYTPSAGNSAPTLSGVVLKMTSNSMPIVLVENTTVSVSVVGTITDTNGGSDISSATGTIYLTGVSGSEACSASDINCYPITSGNCSLSAAVGNDKYATCTAALWFLATRTDDDTASWTGFIAGKDAAGVVGTGTDTEEVSTLQALQVTASIPYSGLSPAATTSIANQIIVQVTTTGNEAIDLTLQATNDMCDTAVCTGNQIASTQQQYTTNSNLQYEDSGDDFGESVKLASTSAKSFNIGTVTPTTHIGNTSDEADDVYWKIGIPTGTASGNYNGTTTVTSKTNSNTTDL